MSVNDALIIVSSLSEPIECVFASQDGQISQFTCDAPITAFVSDPDQNDFITVTTCDLLPPDQDDNSGPTNCVYRIFIGLPRRFRRFSLTGPASMDGTFPSMSRSPMVHREWKRLAPHSDVIARLSQSLWV